MLASWPQAHCCIFKISFLLSAKCFSDFDTLHVCPTCSFYLMFRIRFIIVIFKLYYTVSTDLFDNLQGLVDTLSGVF